MPIKYKEARDELRHLAHRIERRGSWKSARELREILDKYFFPEVEGWRVRRERST